jgi:hypothetical protein
MCERELAADLAEEEPTTLRKAYDQDDSSGILVGMEKKHERLGEEKLSQVY